MKRTCWFSLGVASMLVGAACSGGKTPAGSGSSPASGQTEEAKTCYAMGAMMGSNLKQFRFSPSELEQFKQGLTDSASGAKLQVALEEYMGKVQQLAAARAQASALEVKSQGKAFADAAAQEPGAVRTPSGLVFRTLTPGAGASPNVDSAVKVHYHGTLPDGTVFDSSVKRGQPVEFPLRGVIPCWTEALQRMKQGEKAKIVCPSDIAYRDQGRPPTIPGGATLVFEVELLEVKAAAAPPPRAPAPR